MKIKSDEEIEHMTKGGHILKIILDNLKNETKIGVTELELDNVARELCKRYKVIPAFLKYKGYPNSLCISVNDTVVHGIPSSYKIANSDVVSLDFGIIYKGLYLDSATSFQVGDKNDSITQFLAIVKKSMLSGLKAARDGVRVGDISYAMESVVDQSKYGIVKELTGHGIGYRLHEDPFIPGYGNKKEGMLIKKGMTLAIESMINFGSDEVIMLSDGWTIKTKDHSISGHFEHTILVTDSNPKILTI
ncbi:type I methionyl aminopeptidase [Patescibacteria group bacterium]|nr:type I methionyl aminopeptidase [Patescibacteria group bacterium]